MAFVISNDKRGGYPAITAVGSDEETACAVYAMLQNAALCARVDEQGVVTNSFDGYYNETILTTHWASFEALREHILEVHEIELRSES